MVAQMMLVLVLLLMAAPSHAGELGRHRVLGFDGAQTVRLDGVGAVRLAGVHVPEAQSQAVEQALRAGPWVAVEEPRTDAVGVDRWGRRLVRLVEADGRDVAEGLVHAGLALVAPMPASGWRHAVLLELEEDARQRRRGLWGEPNAPLATALTAATLTGRLAVIEGRVREVGTTDRHVYLNFAADWRSDFTIRLRRPELARLLGRWVDDVERLAGRRVRARGLVIEAGGPLVEVAHPEQFEVLP